MNPIILLKIKQMNLKKSLFYPLNYLLFSVVFLSCFSASGQKSKVLSAQNYLQSYHSSKDCEELGNAKEAIELALTHEASADWAKTWYYRGNIYYDIYASVDDQCRGIAPDALDLAYESFMKCLELDEKDRYVQDIDPKISVIASLYVQRGANYFNKKEYSQSLSDFEKSVEVARRFQKTDTTALYNAALAAEKLKNYSKAAMYYEGLIDIGYNEARLYHFLSEAYSQLGDSAKAFQAIKSGRIAHPTNADLIIDELNYFLANGQHQMALENLGKAIKSMPENEELYFARGTIHDNHGSWELARDDYMKALDVKPEHFNSNYNLGALFFNKGVEKIEDANSFGENEQSKFKAAVAEADNFFKMALPYLEKANEIDPHDRDTMVSLKNLYSRMGNEKGYKRISDILDN